MINELFKADPNGFPGGASEVERDRGLHQFRVRFQRSVRSCVKRGFSVEECFGMVWEETMEEVRLSDADQPPLYEKLIKWAKTSLTRPTDRA
jgi:hypothetical protein